MRTYALTLFVLSLSLAALACGGSSAKSAEPTPATEPAAAPAADPAGDPTCEQVADHVIELVLNSEEFKAASAEEQKAARDSMPDARPMIVQQCADKAFSAEVKTCMIKAESGEAMKACVPEAGKP